MDVTRPEDEWEEAAVYSFSALDEVDPRGEKVYSVSEAAKQSGLSEKLLRKEIEDGKMPIIRVPGERRTMVRRQDLDNYIRIRRKRKKRGGDKKI
jgi:excisionase family DNA binding protein